MKKLILAIVGLSVGIIIGMTIGSIVNAQQAVKPCPDGSYSIGTEKNGEHICKLEPTGCPYGDSIPLGADCDKHAPVEPIVEHVAPVSVEYVGGGK